VKVHTQAIVSLTFLCVMLAGLCGLGCDEERAAQPTPDVALVDQTIDRTTQAGRLFMYLDDVGEVVKTSDYDQIPLAKRGAVMVIEGRKKGRVRKGGKKKGGIQVEPMPDSIRIDAKPASIQASAGKREGGSGGGAAVKAPEPVAEDTAGSVAARAIIDSEGKAGPPSTKWGDEAWRDEIKRELTELRKEQEKDDAVQEED
jgi:hypothetical protein